MRQGQVADTQMETPDSRGVTRRLSASWTSKGRLRRRVRRRTSKESFACTKNEKVQGEKELTFPLSTHHVTEQKKETAFDMDLSFAIPTVLDYLGAASLVKCALCSRKFLAQARNLNMWNLFCQRMTVRRPSPFDNQTVFRMTQGPDEKILCSVGRSLGVLDASTGLPTPRQPSLSRHSGTIFSITCDIERDLIFTADERGRVVQWNVRFFDLCATARIRNTQPIWHMSIRGDTLFLARPGYVDAVHINTLKCFQTYTKDVLKLLNEKLALENSNLTIAQVEPSVFCTSTFRSGSALVAGDDAGYLTVWRCSSAGTPSDDDALGLEPSAISFSSGSSDPIRALAVLDDAFIFAGGAMSGKMFIYRASQNLRQPPVCECRFDAHRDAAVHSIIFERRLGITTMLTAGEDRTIKIWRREKESDATLWSCQRKLSHDADVSAMVTVLLEEKSRLLLWTSSYDLHIRCWEAYRPS